ncbi:MULTISPECIES: response regulator transcription factor [unclassified Variovorax]|uniref:response regulator transcription factor n=1 Tax=unclassified Variovorax TaxID=663243 RepID=UPI0025754899|nr:MULTISPECIES: response regulator transcription factor [unclassified Variovorax]MDM0088785.1 response regulator transcription factor [Variovorax sp. J22G40]MDM0146858.1 response regulator transcription factor [Variovorax sp. J2P1-31]
MKIITTPRRLRVHVLEDDDDLREEMLFSLAALGFQTAGFPTAPEFYKAFAIAPCDVAVIDIGLPGESGLSVVSHLRAAGGVGVVLVTARGQLDERLLGLRSGADAYLVKPVHIDELAETLNALGRRLPPAAAPAPVAASAPPAPAEVRAGTWRLLEGEWIVADPNGLEMKLTTSERAFMGCLFRRRGQTVSRDELILALGGDVFDFDGHRVDAIASRVRRKARKLGMRLPLYSVRGTGYVLAK